jgi:5,10-methylene-tetrahydrofolate dehydrogenase/methenyl tetrahydrofolate cyclohydrolase
MLRLVALTLLATATAFAPMRALREASTALHAKTIAVIGASGLTASECVYQALKNGDSVVGLTRCVKADLL